MADRKVDVHRTLSYGSERYHIRHVPLALIMVLLGLATRVWPAIFPWQGRMLGVALAIAGFAYIVFAAWRRYVSPGPPWLVLSPAGIDQHLSHGGILHVPWDEVQDVVSVDYRVAQATLLDVPAVQISEAFYGRAMPPQRSGLQAPALSWAPASKAADGTMQILFRPDVLGARAEDLRQAIEARWRAYSRHPNASLPPSEASQRRAAAWRVWVSRLLVPSVLVLCALAFLYLFWSSVRP